MKNFLYLIILFLLLFHILGCTSDKWQYEYHIDFESSLSKEDIVSCIFSEIKLQPDSYYIQNSYYRLTPWNFDLDTAIKIIIVSPYDPLIEVTKRDNLFRIRIYSCNFKYNYDDLESQIILKLGTEMEMWAKKNDHNIKNFYMIRKKVLRQRSLVN